MRTLRTAPWRAFAWMLLALLPSAVRADDVWTGVERVVAVGDIHGDYEQFVAVLRSAEVVDEQLNWRGGRTHLVQSGDVLDRGPDSRKVMDLLLKLEDQAHRAGGAVHALIGNHEAMNLYGDLRYVSPAEFAAFRIEGAKETDPGKPAGFDERRRQFGPDGKYGKWIRRHNAVIRINDTVFVHGGIGPKYASAGIREINERIREELAVPSKLEGGVAADPEGPLWYRGLATGDEKTLAAHLNTVLRNLQARRIVIGHTFTDGAVTPRFAGKVLMIDIGLARLYDAMLRQACLVVERGQPYALHRGKRLELPSEDPRDVLRYLKAAAALDPQPSPLEKRIAALESSLTVNSAP